MKTIKSDVIQFALNRESTVLYELKSCIVKKVLEVEEEEIILLETISQMLDMPGNY